MTPATSDLPGAQIQLCGICLAQAPRHLNRSTGSVHEPGSLEDALDVHVRFYIDVAQIHALVRRPP